MFEAVKVALDPTPAQERLMLSHAGAARFAYNAGLAHVKAAIEAGEKPEWSLFSLQHWWVENRDTLAVDEDGVIWWRENSKEAYRSGLRWLAEALSNWSKSR
ncbi:MAG: helix-turn-helix domain-containing protein [Trueperella pyogenes]|nr:helix-turn-helix domain-containing protein [Trueperella pyogenes]